VRLARCQLALGQSNAALSALRAALALEPQNTSALQLQDKARDLEAHLRNVDGARARADWPMARLALDRCFTSIEGEGSEIPTEWRVWRVEMELARGNLDQANTAAKCVVVHALETGAN
jgi:DnaJ family protein C protein 7